MESKFIDSVYVAMDYDRDRFNDWFSRWKALKLKSRKHVLSLWQYNRCTSALTYADMVA